MERRPLGVQVAVATLMFAFTLPLVCVVALAVGGTIGPGEVVAAALFASLAARGQGRRGALSLGLWFALLLAACALSSAVSDTSFDGQAYHQEAIRQLLSGWNPLRAPAPPPGVRYPVLLEHYPKAAWMAAAALARPAHNLEAAKALGWLLLAANGLLATALLRARGLDRFSAPFFGLLLASGPVVCDQLFTFYVDGLLSSSLLAAGLCILLFWESGDRVLAGIALLALLFACNLKFTGVGYAAVLASGGLAWVLFRRRSESRAALGWAAVLTVGLLLSGANPYLFNLARKGNPFFPVVGAGAGDVLAVGPAASFRSDGRLRLFATSILARSSNEIGGMPELKIPLSYSAQEWSALGSPDVRIGGFGPWFGAAFLFALIVLVVVRPPLPWWLIAGGTVASALLTRATFWARLVPQVWWAPVVVAIAAVNAPRGRSRLLGYLLGALLLGNLVLTGLPCLITQIGTSHDRRARAPAAKEASP